MFVAKANAYAHLFYFPVACKAPCEARDTGEVGGKLNTLKLYGVTT